MLQAHTIITRDGTKLGFQLIVKHKGVPDPVVKCNGIEYKLDFLYVDESYALKRGS